MTRSIVQRKTIDRAGVKETWDKQGAVPLKISPAEFDKFLRADIEKWPHVIKVSGMQTQWRSATGNANKLR
jgi:tripartite-type tricarboxylate transporter receptor subunit TctC